MFSIGGELQVNTSQSRYIDLFSLRLNCDDASVLDGICGARFYLSGDQAVYMRQCPLRHVTADLLVPRTHAVAKGPIFLAIMQVKWVNLRCDI